MRKHIAPRKNLEKQRVFKIQDQVIAEIEETGQISPGLGIIKAKEPDKYEEEFRKRYGK